jgi:hypothetical protein
MLSANQVYKNSNTELPFKEWLKREQLKGKLDETYTGVDVEVIPCDCKPLIKFLAGVAIGYVVCKMITNK